MKLHDGDKRKTFPKTAAVDLPPLRELGFDLLRLSVRRRLLTLSLPFLWRGAYFAFAVIGWWPLAVFSLVGLI
jgi:hypothetical protein